MMTFLLYTLLSTTFWYLGSRALITRPIWSRYPPRFASFADCASCTGFWWGLLLALLVGRHEDLVFMNLAADDTLTPLIVAFSMIASVPICAGIMQWGLWQAGSALDVDQPSSDDK